MIELARQDPALDDRDDVLALMLQARYDDGTGMTRGAIGDQLLTLLTAGHETTATTLAWAVERLRRHPDVLLRLAAEADAGQAHALRDAAIWEVQRTRPVIERTIRQVRAPVMQLGRWTVLRGQRIAVSIATVHSNPDLFPDPDRFDPDRFLHARPGTYDWIPFGGGIRRCIGAAFAHMEMDVVLRMLLCEFTLELRTTPVRPRRVLLRHCDRPKSACRGSVLPLSVIAGLQVVRTEAPPSVRIIQILFSERTMVALPRQPSPGLGVCSRRRRVACDASDYQY